MRMFCTGLNFVLELYLGVTAEERKELQSVELNFEFTNKQSLQCASDDDAEDYMCYQKILKSVVNRFSKTEVKLLEYLCVQIHHLIKGQVSKGTLVNVFVKKQCSNIVYDKNAEAYCKCVEF